mmetsp:Transcript_7260/g.10199  ORF Transcript_7260/g.10199 Transcript_7260/m.10199 type:complete len:94 (+) Transcript_7260:1090-1371(+)
MNPKGSTNNGNANLTYKARVAGEFEREIYKKKSRRKVLHAVVDSEGKLRSTRGNRSMIEKRVKIQELDSISRSESRKLINPENGMSSPKITNV